MSLKKYQQKRSFNQTPEPKGKEQKSKGALKFVVQKHHASHLHYDFRLEMEGVLKSWAVPKGPSLNPDDKRLAMMVEDHPYSYRSFEGVIPEGNYGAGNVIVWDQGTYQTYEGGSRAEQEKELLRQLNKGHLTFIMHGQKLKGEFGLVKIRDRGNSGKGNSWLLVKANDEFASKKDITKENRSVLSDKDVEKVGKDPRAKKWLSKSEEEMPKIDKPMLATLVDEPFDRKGWIFEIKFDGYRALARVEDGKVDLRSRNNLSFNERFAPIAEALSRLGANAILDGEIVAEGSKGVGEFQLLQNYQRDQKGKLIYNVFDLLYLNGENLMEWPLIKRKELLKELVRTSKIKNLRYSDHIEGKGVKFFDAAGKKGFEGIMAKKDDSDYKPGVRTENWLKIKTHKRQEVVIGGWTEPRGSRKLIGALVVGVYEGDELVYAGHTGGGFNVVGLENLYEKLKKIETKTSPFTGKFKLNSPVHWVKPKLVAEISFQDWTEDGSMRQPIFEGMREDKNPKEVVREKEKHMTEKKSSKLLNSKREVKFSNLDKIYWPKEKITKGDLVDYYDKISKYILPYLVDRPESLNRYPGGINGPSFFQKDTDHEGPPWLEKLAVPSESENKDIDYILCQNKETLLYLANLGCIEINPWSSRVGNLDNPDFLVIDLDPEKISFEKVIEAAQVTKKVFDSLDIESYCKTSGATGLHIFVPMAAKYNYDQVKEFAHIIATLVNEKLPKTTSLERRPIKRQKKIYIDFLQNRKGQTLAAPYSVRPKPGATVSTPLKWSEVKSGLSPSDFTIKNIFKRIEKVGDLWKPVLGKGANIEKALKKLS